MSEQSFERRQILQILAGTAVGLPGASLAATNEIVLCNWGGAAEKAIKAAYGDVVKKDLDKTLAVDGSGPLAGKLRAMVEAKNVVWDVADLDLGNTAQLGEAGLMEEIDYGIVDKSKVLDGLTTKWGIGNYLYSYIFAVNEKVAKGAIPQTWADFWNVKDFPGKRALPGNSSQGVFEAALLADGVDPANLYPMDIGRAIAKIKTIKANSVYWKSGAQSEDFLRQNEVLASLMWSNRAVVVRRQFKNIAWTWNKAILAASGWGVPKGNPAGRAAAMKLIDIMLDPKGQAKVFEVVGMSPSNPAAVALIPAEEQAFNATGFAAQQVRLQDSWYAKNASAADAEYLQAISS